MLAECFGALLQAVGTAPYQEKGENFRIRFEGDMDLSFIRHGTALAVRMPLADPPSSADGRRGFLRMVLRTGLGLMPESGAGVFLVPSLAPDGRLMLEAALPAEPQAFVQAVGVFMNGAEKWRLAIQKGGGIPPSGPIPLSFGKG